jgi:hypothetical protein
MSSNSRAAAAAGSLLTLTLALGTPAQAEVDLAALQVAPQRGQSADQVRRDRYECHNWAIEQSGVVPSAAPTREEAKESDRARRAQRWSRVLAGAAIGGSIGGLIQAAGDEHPDDAVLAGAAVGAVVGAATGARKRESAEDAESSEYLRALTACLEGRGYTVASPADGEEDASSASLPRSPTTRGSAANASASASPTVG